MEKYTYLKMRLNDERITYKELARELMINTVTVSNKLNGKAVLNLNEFKKILEIIDEYDEEEICKLLNIKTHNNRTIKKC